MTEDELKAEWNYRYQERLGMLCGEDDPNIEQHEIAKKEADKAVEQLRDQ